MANSRYVVDLTFKSDTKAVEQNLTKLKNTLNTISLGKGLGISQEISKASAAARDLQSHMQNAMNVKTGNLDLSKFATSLKNSGQSLSQLTSGLLGAGEAGEEAFFRTHQAISNANLKLKESNGLLSSFMVTLKNTIKWQLSSSLVQGFVGGIREAIQYTKDLDKSLNDIRIVTGYSADRMKDFAIQANQAAKELSTSTKAYAKASLIYFQQGLNDEEVKARTDITVKMARVTGEAAQDVSSYMTAIWNNFDDGSKSLEHYADVITALGAATASSSEEIAGGLEKFAAIAETVGLSYEYATTALATVVAETRQSEETVGTSFKTIFGRLQSLNLGESLEDGTTLTKYSNALDIVGIQIKGQNGELKEMDQILDELGGKWAGLSDETKVALANTVAGTRQYANFIALMDNYDTFKVNLEIAESAKGTLEDQFKIYEQSWEGASNRLKASAEGMYSKLIPEDTLIEATDAIAKIVDGLGEVVDSFGGLKGILLTVTTILLNKFQPAIANAINTGITKVKEFGPAFASAFKNSDKKGFWGFGERVKESVYAGTHANELSTKAEAEASLNSALTTKGTTDPFRERVRGIQEITKYTEMLNDQNNKLSTTQKQALLTQIQALQALKDQNYEYQISQERIENIIDDAKQLAVINSREKATTQITTKKGNTVYGVETDTVEDAKATSKFLATRRGLDGEDPLNVSTIMGKKADGTTQSYVTFNSEEDRNDALERSMGALGSAGYALGALEATETGIDSDEQLEILDQEIKLGEKKGSLQAEEIEQLKEILKILEQIKQAKAEIASNTFTPEEEEEYNRLKARADSNEVFVNPAEEQRFEELSAKKARKTSTEGTLETASKNLPNAMKQTKNQLNAVAGAAKKASRELGASEEHTEGIFKNSRQYAKQQGKIIKSTKDQAKLTNKIGEGFNKAKASITSFGNVASGLASGISNIAMGVNMAFNAFEKLQDGEFTFADIGASVMALVSILGGLVSTLGTLNSIYTGLNTTKQAKIITDILEKEITEQQTEEEMTSLMMKKFHIAEDKKAAVQDAINLALEKARKEAAEKETTVTKKETAAIIAKTIAQYASNIPLLICLAIILLLIAAVLIIVAAYSNWTKKIKANAEASIEQTEALQEEIAAQEEAIATYAKALKTYEETKTNKEELIEAGKSLMKAYDMEQGELELLRGDYEAFNQILSETIAKKAEANKVTLEGNASTQAAALGLTIRKGKGHKSGGQIKAEFNSGASTSDEAAIYTAIQSKSWKTLSYDSSSKDINLVFDRTDPEQYVTAYDEIQEVLKLAREANGGKAPTDSEIYNEMFEEIGSWENIDALKKTLDSKHSEERKAKRYSIKSSSGKKITQINDIRDYTSYRENLEKSGQFKAEELDSDLASDEFSKEMEALYQNFNTVARTSLNITDLDKATEEDKKAIKERSKMLQDIYADLSDEEKEIFFQIKWENVDVNDPNSLQAAINEVKEKGLDLKIEKYYEEQGLDLEAYESYLTLLQASNEALKENSILAKEAALQTTMLNQGVSKLVDIEDDLFSTLTDDNASLYERAQALSKVRDAFEAMLGIEVSDQFILTNADDIAKARTGDMAALGRVIDKATVSSVDQELGSKEFIESLKTSGPLSEMSDAEIQAEVNNAKEKIKKGFESIGTTNDNLQLGQSYDIGETAKQQFTEALESGVITIEDIEKWFKGQGESIDVKKNADGTYSFSTATKVIDTSLVAQSQFEVEEIDKNKQFEETIKGLQNSLDELSAKKEAAYGQNKLDLIDQEIAKNEELLEVYRQQSAMLQGEEASALQSLADSLGLSVEELKTKYGFDPTTGTFAYYTQMAIDANNSESFNEAYDKYADARDKRTEADMAALEKEFEIRTQALEKVQYTVEVKLALDEMSLAKVENELERLGENWENVYSRIGRYNLQAALAESQFDTHMNAFKSVYDPEKTDYSPEEIAQLQESYNGMIEAEQSLRSIKESYISDFEDSISQISEDIEKEANIIDSMRSMTESYSNIVELLGKENLPEANKILEKIDSSVVQISRDAMQATKSRQETNRKALEEARLALEASVGDDSSIQYWSDEIARLEEESLELEETLIGNFESALDAARTLFTNNVNRAISDMETAIAGSFESLAYMQSFYNQQKELDDLYLDDYEKTYELNKIMRQINTSIDETDNIRAKQKLQEIQAEINKAAEEENELSQQDLDILQKKYELKMAEIALEEAQNAKTQVRLTKNDAGSWTYVYTANQANIDKAQQDYEDKLYALQKANEDYTDQYTEYLLNLETSFGSGLNEILEMEFETTEKKVEAMKQYLSSNITKIKAYIDGIKETSGEDLDLTNTIFKDSDSLDSYMDKLVNGLTNTVNTAIEEIKNYESTVDEIQAEMTPEDMDEYLNQSLDDFTTRSEDALNSVNALGETLTTTYEDLSSKLVSFQEIYHNLMISMVSDIETVYEATGKLVGKLDEIGSTQKIGVYIAGGTNNFAAGAISSLDTGGYTGSWGSSGKLAVLHEKEIVLNKEDTANLLSIIDTLNGSLLERMAAASVPTLAAVDSSKFIDSYTNNTGDTLTQDVTIHAEFPNATNHQEIEQAFEDIINMASQYANRKD